MDPYRGSGTTPQTRSPFEIQEISTLPEVRNPSNSEDDNPKFYNEPAEDSPKEAIRIPLPLVQPHARRDRFLRWPYLLLYTLLVGLVAGLIGGFIGKAITENKRPIKPRPGSGSANPGDQRLSPSSCPSNPNSNNTATTAGSNRETFIAQQDTLCPQQNNDRTLQSDHIRLSYRKICNTDFTGTDLIGLFAPTMSDCIEQCQMWNTVRNKNDMCTANAGGSERPLAQECQGASFVPRWAVNRTEPMDRFGFWGNCFLKAAIRENTPNKWEGTGLEIVGLCFEGKCELARA